MYELLKSRFGIDEEDESKWPTVHVLRSEDITRRKTFHFETSAIRGKMKVLVAKLEALEAERDAMHTEFWEHLYSSYDLPRGGKYTLTEDHKIKKKPGHASHCDCGKCGS